MGFRKDFVWGAATAAYQVEGAAYEDGKGLSIWDVYCKDGGHIYEDHSGDVSCDQYHHVKEDVQLMKKMGLKAYRFSLSWSRILPEGTGKVNEQGIAYYNLLINELVENGIEPYVTLYHWDLPYALHLQGGWMNPRISEWFYEYAKVVAERFSDRVTHFFTLNEPQAFASPGYYEGTAAPGLTAGKKVFFQVWHNLLMAHGRAVQALREYSVQPVKIGIATTSAAYYPATESEADIDAARRATFQVLKQDVRECNWNLGFICEPIYRGKYPDEVVEMFGEYMPEIKEEDMRVISQPVDFHAQNIYNAVPIKAGENNEVLRVKRYEGYAKTAAQWPVEPECLYWITKFLYERYHMPIYISENGMSSHDWVCLDGKVHDYARIDFLNRYLKTLKRAAEENVDVVGYFVWTFIDNFEWTLGYSERFGLVYVDYRTQERIVKDSGMWYSRVISENGHNL